MDTVDRGSVRGEPLNAAAEAVGAAARAVGREADVEAAAGFARAVLRRVPAEALRRAAPGQVGAAILARFVFVADRSPDDISLRVLDRSEPAVDGSIPNGTLIDLACDDRDFIVTSLTEELHRLGHKPTRLVRASFGRRRDEDGHLLEVGPARGADEGEAFLEIELEGYVSPADSASVVRALSRVLDDVVSATSDYPMMRRQIEQAADRTRANGRLRFDPEEVAETAALVEWLLSGHLVLLGTCVFPVRDGQIGPADERALGVLRDEGSPLRQPPAELPGRLLDVARSPEISTVHRQAPMQRLDLVLLDGHGRPDAIGRLVAVFSNRAEASQVTSIPLLRWKLRRILELEDCVVGSYDEQTVVSLFQAIPKDELFHDDVPTLHATIAQLLAETRDDGVRVLLHVDEPSRTVSVLVTLASEAWTRSLRQRLERFVTTQLDGSRVDTDISLGGATDAVVRMIVHVRPDASMPTDSLEGVAREVRQLCRTWEQRLLEALRERVGDQADRLLNRWSDRFPSAYRDSVEPRVAADDIADLDVLDDAGAAGIRLRLRLDGNGDMGNGERGGDARLFHLRITSPGGIELSKLLPVLESVGLWVVDEQHWSLAHGDRHIHDLGVRGAGDTRIDMVEDPARLVDALNALWAGRAEVDSLNRLVLEAGLTWQQVSLLRAYRRFRRQVDTRYTNEYMNDVLVAHPRVARSLLDLFATRFGADPAAGNGGKGLKALAERCRDLCDKVERLDHDRILRGLLGTIEATLRTNHYLRPDGPFAIKIDSAAVPDAPAPRPYREIFVHGPTVEGLHLRAGPVARGGLRWSDRPEDYRAEVLDLMRTQVLKNAVIVPTGAKGGFVTKGDDGGDPRAHARRAYEAFITGLLDVTDNIQGEEVVPVPGRRDGDDPYLVVAADKGTATFSDVANDLAVRRGFWLGDAFASGGSQGYDHKALGITARGAWVAVQRHFRDLGIDVQTEPFTVVGVGDMSGDVFGNGMLRSEHTRLVAAFDHRDIFLDPEPDPARTFEERKRLFGVPRSSWQDFDREAISEGGGVFSRSLKSIPLSRQARAALRLDVDEVTPAELVQAVLRAPVDLLYLGGIGTYVRASTEDDRRLDDRANADLRVTASSLRARVVGEGANLGFTQRARIEYARRGGRINMDAIDNAAGVDTSDHEVNLKILLGLAVDADEITPEERNGLLVEHVDDVVRSVLADTAFQCDCLSHAVQPSALDLPAFVAVLDELVAIGVIDPEVESLPDAAELEARRRAEAGLTRPELAVLLAGVKRKLRADVLESDLPDDPATRDALVGYFPPGLAKRFDHLLDRHRLRRELVTSEIANDLVDRMGLTFPHRLGAEAGVGSAAVARAYWYASRVIDAASLWARIDQHTGTPTTTVDTDQVDGKQVVADLLESLTRHELLIRHAPATLTERIAHERPVFLSLRQELPRLDRPAQRRARSRLREQLMGGGLASSVADEVAALAELDLVPDAALLARGTGRPASEVAAAMLRVSDRLGLDRVRDRVRMLPSVDGWARSARQGLLDDLDGLRREAARRALEGHPGEPGESAADRYLDERPDRIDELVRVLRRLESDRDAGLDALTVVVRAVRHAAT